MQYYNQKQETQYFLGNIWANYTGAIKIIGKITDDRH